jgi:hypothetical protein
VRSSLRFDTTCLMQVLEGSVRLFIPRRISLEFHVNKKWISVHLKSSRLLHFDTYT